MFVWLHTGEGAENESLPHETHPYQSSTYSKLPVVELVGNEHVTFFKRLSGPEPPPEPEAAAAMGQELSCMTKQARQSSEYSLHSEIQAGNFNLLSVCHNLLCKSVL